MHHETPTLQELADAMYLVAAATREPSLRKLLGEPMAIELGTVAAGFRQRFPHHWPTAQQQLPLE